MKLTLKRGVQNYDGGLAGAAAFGSDGMVDFFIGLGATKLFLGRRLMVTRSEGLLGAVISGNQNLIDYFFRGDYDFQTLLSGAAKTGNLDQVKRILKKHEHDFDLEEALEMAVLGGNLEVVKFLHEEMAKEENFGGYNTYMFQAAKSGNMDVIQFLIDNGETDMDSFGCKKGSLPLLKFFLDRTEEMPHRTHLTDIIMKYSTLELLKYFFEMRPPTNDDVLLAAKYRREEITEYLVDLLEFP